MRAYLLAIAGAALFALPTSALSQGIEIGPGGVQVTPGPSPYYHDYHDYQGRHWERCRHLRWACIHKEELGEQGLGNCRRYRELCR